VKRFWSTVHVEAAEGGHAIRLDTRPVRTPARAPMVLPTRPLAEAVAAEWEAQGDVVRPLAMPLTRAANAAIDRVIPEREAVAALIAGYGESDLVCYRAPGPDGLIDRQSAAWDPLIDWAETRFGARLVPAEGVMFVAQPRPARLEVPAPGKEPAVDAARRSLELPGAGETRVPGGAGGHRG